MPILIAAVSLVVLAAIGVVVYKKFFTKSEDTAELTLAAGDVVSKALPGVSDTITSVIVSFTEVQLQPAEGDRLTFNVVKDIDLLSNIGNELLADQEVPVGKYEWIRLVVDPLATHIVDAGAEKNISIPSNVLKLNRGFEVGEGGADFMIDFNLEKSLKVNNSGVFMKPVLALIDNGPVPAPEPTPEVPVEEEVVE